MQATSSTGRSARTSHGQLHHAMARKARLYGAATAASVKAVPTDGELLTAPLTELTFAAARLRDRAYTHITFSPKVFLPLTRLCRDSCGYCTFAAPPLPGRRAYMTVQEVLDVARLGAQQGCAEALFTLGDKPELRWPQAAAELQSLGFHSTLEYLEHVAGVVLEQTGLLPHINAGVMDENWMRRLKRVSASQGLMLESTAYALLNPGSAHHDCPDKDPAARLAALEAAGRAQVPFTTGILVGIGETRQDRLQALRAIRASHDRHGHIQEVIVQNFRAKKGTLMSLWPEPPLSELLWTCAAARLILGSDISLQCPPNLTPEPDDAATSAHDASNSTDDTRMASWRALLDAGINDWGGLSPITRDHVNPEAPWPHLHRLSQATANAGFHLLPRLPVYPRYLELQCKVAHEEGTRSSQSMPTASARDLVTHHSSSKVPSQSTVMYSHIHAPQPPQWLDCQGGRSSARAAVLRASDSAGLLRGSSWYAGMTEDSAMQPAHQDTTTPDTPAPAARAASHAASSVPPVRVRRDRVWRVAISPHGDLQGAARPEVAREVQCLLDKVLQAAQQGSPDNPLSESDILRLLTTRGADAEAVMQAADHLRRVVCGETVTYVVNRNINYTNVCLLKCGFCAFSKGKASESLRGPAYLVPLEEITRRTREAWERGATEVCMQGGIHPDFTGHTYLSILEAAKRGAPNMHIHAFSPLEVHQGAQSLGLPVAQYLQQLRSAGLGSLPGTAAEVLDDDVRAVLCPDKINTDTWLEVLSAAHHVGLRTTSTLMFGHLEHVSSWARHLVALRALQQQTGGITEFVPLPFVHMMAPVYQQGAARQGPTLHECTLLHSVARLALHPHITNIQASWVKMGPEHASGLLAAGCNDMGGVLMNETITRAAGADHGQEVSPARMEALIRAAGRNPRQRTTLYGVPPSSQTHRSLQSWEPLQPLVQSPR